MSKEILKELTDNLEQYDAHIITDETECVTKRELLEEHTFLTMDVFQHLWEEKCADMFLVHFWGRLCEDLTSEGRKFWKELIWGIPLFHDYGKVNSAFQKQKMKNNRLGYESELLERILGSKHSMLSAIVYIDYFLAELKKEVSDRKDKKLLRNFILLHAYIIERHHSDLNDFEKFIQSLQSGVGSAVIEVFLEKECKFYKKEFHLTSGRINDVVKSWKKWQSGLSYEENVALYCYEKLMYSLLVTSDYYATAEFMSGVKIDCFGNLNDIELWFEIYENTPLMKGIRRYQKEEYPKAEDVLKSTREINVLRTEMLSDAERVLMENRDGTLFYLEAPTGSGKSNTALDLTFQLMKEDKTLRKIYYIYPFNTLVEQNMQSLRKVFGENEDIMHNVAVVNSLTPIKMTQKEKMREAEEEVSLYYQRALLDRQFLNYPMILTTHVSLFDTMFGDTKESAFGFHQLMNSVIVLDEIQSYKNTIWGEIICFLKEFAHLLNMKVIIMSATLPDLDFLTGGKEPAVRLMKNTEKYFSNPCFKNRVKISYELLDLEDVEEALYEHLKIRSREGKKILVEFIKKDSAYHFFTRLSEDSEIMCEVEYMSGDDSLAERSRILHKIKNVVDGDGIILVATQVIEAGVDIDMDIGYKNISKLDSEEQFLGRINRSCLRNGVVYFFKLDDGKRIYGEDIRSNREFTLENEEIRKVLLEKDFRSYYGKILEVLKKNYNDNSGEIGLEYFFREEVGRLNWFRVKERMKLISADSWSMSVYLARRIIDENGEMIDGQNVWKDYVELLADFSMGYAEKRVKLSRITSKMNYFIYQIKRNADLQYHDKVGEIFYIEDGEKFFENGKLNRKKLQGEVGDFVDFI